MTSIPRHNLSERMIKLGYDPSIVKILPPVLDQSKVIRKEEQRVSYQPTQHNQQEFKPLASVNIDEWSDFEEED